MLVFEDSGAGAGAIVVGANEDHLAQSLITAGAITVIQKFYERLTSTQSRENFYDSKRT